MIGYIIIGGIVALITALFVWRIRVWALEHMLDIPNARSAHNVPTPSGGGLAITIITLVGFAIWQVRLGVNLPYLVFVVVGALLGGLGWVDDRYELDAKLRLGLQGLGAVIIVIALGALQSIQLWDGFVLVLPYIIGAIISIFWVLAFTNVYNFMDGIDGLAASQAIIAGLAWSILAYRENLSVVLSLSLLLASTSLGFLYWNRPKAKIFMGDVGSTFLGFAFASAVLFFYQTSNDPRAFITGLFFVGIFAFDSGFTIIRRGLNGENVLAAHRSHLYQRLVHHGKFTHRAVTTLYSLLMLISVGLGFVYFYGASWLPLTAVVLELTMCTAIFLGVTYIERRTALKSPNAIAD